MVRISGMSEKSMLSSPICWRASISASCSAERGLLRTSCSESCFSIEQTSTGVVWRFATSPGALESHGAAGAPRRSGQRPASVGAPGFDPARPIHRAGGECWKCLTAHRTSLGRLRTASPVPPETPRLCGARDPLRNPGEARGGELRFLSHQFVNLARQKLNVRSDFADIFTDADNLNQAHGQTGQDCNGGKSNCQEKLNVGDHFVLLPHGRATL